ncbi:hypothetical protein K450DRAFT_237387 [Umbelopsis ramanniana AG]|uniref:Uncharacterized protein n=1 Tax=Umbelopsis ramanniana AG TaxID=1314678 RepID=A0AAD5EBN8_UMBRA|nr:uncharacterized protein K450DRAFT_237387 [Umbelopsis ramanniana AG]KAI8580509.1 hypothetical protein K450DRAFT_237387 [Umbelopsis ramanniana AG]
MKKLTSILYSYKVISIIPCHHPLINIFYIGDWIQESVWHLESLSCCNHALTQR